MPAIMGAVIGSVGADPGGGSAAGFFAGFALLICTQLVEAGASSVIADILDARRRAQADALSRSAPYPHLVLTRPDEVASGMQTAAVVLDGLDGLVNNLPTTAAQPSALAA